MEFKMDGKPISAFGKWNGIALLFLPISFLLFLCFILPLLLSGTSDLQTFEKSPFVFTAKEGISYDLMVAKKVEEGSASEPETTSAVGIPFQAIQVTAAYESGEPAGALPLVRNNGTTQFGTTDKADGAIRAYSVAEFKAPKSGQVQVTFGGWEGPGRLYCISAGPRSIAFLFGVACVNVVFSFFLAWKIYELPGVRDFMGRFVGGRA